MPGTLFDERQHAAVVLQDDQRRRHRAPGHRAVLGRADLRGQCPVDQPLPAVEQAHLALDDQDASGGVVDAALRHGARNQRPHLDKNDEALGRNVMNMSTPAFRQPARVTRSRAAVVVRADEPGEPQLPLEHVGDHHRVRVHPRPLPAAVGGHDRTDAGADHGLVGRQVQRAQRRLVARGVAGVDAVHGAAVAQVVLGVGEHRERPAPLLKAVRVGDAHRGGSSGVSPNDS